VISNVGCGNPRGKNTKFVIMINHLKEYLVAYKKKIYIYSDPQMGKLSYDFFTVMF